MNTTIQGNLVGTTSDGRSALPNTGMYGVAVSSSDQTLVGGPGEGAGNVISGNANVGLLGADPLATHLVIQGNKIGTDITGESALGNGDTGLELDQTVSTTIGGSHRGDRNVISSNGSDGIDLEGTTGAVVEGNRVGTDANGTQALPNQGNGVTVNGGVNDQVGGRRPVDGNLISGNAGNGVAVVGNAHDAVISHNRIGSNAPGRRPLGNQLSGVLIANVPRNGVSANIIASNAGDGVTVSGQQATRNILAGNLIGVGPGATPLPNRGNGIAFVESASGNVVGGSKSAASNLIRYNGLTGVRVASGTQDRVSRNSIYANGHLGILLGSGANLHQVAPHLSSLRMSPGTTEIIGNVAGAAKTTVAVELFSSPHCDPSGAGQGKTYLQGATVVADRSGAALFKVKLKHGLGTGTVVSATATDATGNTSTFSRCLAVH
jgi:hypothetical protein